MLTPKEAFHLVYRAVRIRGGVRIPPRIQNDLDFQFALSNRTMDIARAYALRSKVRDLEQIIEDERQLSEVTRFARHARLTYQNYRATKGLSRIYTDQSWAHNMLKARLLLEERRRARKGLPEPIMAGRRECYWVETQEDWERIHNLPLCLPSYGRILVGLSNLNLHPVMREERDQFWGSEDGIKLQELKSESNDQYKELLRPLIESAFESFMERHPIPKVFRC